jgi:hypothetical protein
MMAAQTTTQTNTKPNMTTIEENIAQNQTEDGDALVQIRGNTYPIREALKALGGRWNADDKVWEVPSSRAEEAKALANAQPPKQPAAPIGRGWLPVKGNTYAVRDILKAQFNARWDGVSKAWLVHPDKFAAAQALVDALKGTSSPTKRCWECGCEFTFAQAKSHGGDWRDSYCGC